MADKLLWTRVSTLILILSAAVCINFADKLEHLAEKADEILILKGTYTQLKDIKGQLPPNVYEEAVEKVLKQASAIVDIKLAENDFQHLLALFEDPKKRSSNVCEVKEWLSFSGVVIVLLNIMIVSGLIYLIGPQFLPFFEYLSFEDKCYVAYCLSLMTILNAFWFSGAAKVLIGFMGSLSLGVGYYFHQEENKNISTLLFEVIVIWLIMALLFESKAIGVLPIILLEIGLEVGIRGFMKDNIPGFANNCKVFRVVVSSFILLCVYVFFKVGNFSIVSYQESITQIFEVGLLSVSSLLYYSGLLILAFDNRDNEDKALSGWANFMMFSSAMFLFVLNYFSDKLSTLCTISTTFFVFYLFVFCLSSQWIKKFVVSGNIATTCGVGIGAILYLHILYWAATPIKQHVVNSL